MYARIVGTIGLLIALPNFILWLVVAVGNDVLDLGLAGQPGHHRTACRCPASGPTPPTSYHPIGGVVLDSDQIAVFVGGRARGLVLWFVLRRTRVGLEMRAVVDREPLAGLRGVNPARTSAVAWMLSMMLAGLGGILIAPLFDLPDIAFTLVVLGSLAAVVLGGLRSIPIAFAGGLLLGVVQNLVAGYTDDILPTSSASSPGCGRRSRTSSCSSCCSSSAATGRARPGSVADDVPRPDHRAGLPDLAATAAVGDVHRRS